MITKARVAVIGIADFLLLISDWVRLLIIAEFDCQSTIRNQQSESSLGVLDNDTLNNIRDVLTAIYRGLELLIDFLPLQHEQRIM